MKDKAKISIIVPVYNTSSFIERCAESIEKQSYDNVERIFVDDGSTDGSKSILDSLASRLNNIIVIHHQSNKGVTEARLTGVRASTGNWIGFVDCDDIVEPEMYERLLNNAQKYHADISHCGYQMVFPSRVDYYYNTGRLVIQDKQSGLKDLIEGTFIEPCLCNKLFQRSLFDRLISDYLVDSSIKYTEDLLMNFYLFREADKSVYEDFCPYHYMIREGSAVTSKLSEHKLSDPLKVLRTIQNETINDRELQKSINTRIAGRLIQVLDMHTDNQEDLIRQYKINAKKELMKMIPTMLKDDYSNRIRVLSTWAAFSPSTYSVVHKAYSMLRGTDKKYEIK